MTRFPERALLPGAEPLALDGGPDAPLVLLSHGFTGTPQTMVPLARSLADAGMTVRVPLLPGHGTRWQDMAITGWPDWLACLESELAALAQRGRRVVVVGLSMGGGLVLRLAERHPDLVAGVVAINPAVFVNDPRFRILPIWSLVTKSYPGVIGDAKNGAPEVGYERVPLAALRSQIAGWRETAGELAKVTCPVLLLTSREDHVVPTDNGERIAAAVSGPVRQVWLENSYHLATIDNDAELVASLTRDFAAQVSR